MPKLEKKQKKIQELLQTKRGVERAKFKGQEIAKKLKKELRKREKFDIEIVDIVTIDNGIEVFARVYDERGKQYGFGRDGTVDIERFRFVNPPIMVRDDQNGDYIREGVDQADGTKYIRKYREDPEEAIMQAIEHTMQVKKQKFLDSKDIQRGKIGKTTTTVYPDADTESTSVDGYVYAQNNDTSSGSWDTVRDAATGHTADDSGIYVSAQTSNNTGHSTTKIRFFRGFILFDTSSIDDDDDIDSATLSLYLDNKSVWVDDGNDFVSVVATTPASNTAITTADYDQVGDTEMHDSGERMDMSDASDSIYHDWAFNATGLAAISKTGVSKFGIREGHDLLDDYYSGASNRRNTANFSSADVSGTSEDPKLVVEHSPAVTNVTATPGAQVITASLPSVTPITGITETPSVQEATFALPAPITILGVTITPDAQVGTFSLPEVNILTPDALVTPSAVVATFAVESPNINLDMVVASAVLEATFNLPSPTVTLGAIATPDAQVITAVVVTPDIITVSVITPDAQVATFSLPTATVIGQTLVTSNAQVATFVIEDPTVLLSAIATPDPVTASFIVNDPAIRSSSYQTKYTVQGDTYGVKYT